MAMKDVLGRAGEDRAVAHLREHGFEVLGRNWRCPDGEIDIVAARDAELVMVEVKTRSSDLFGDPLEAVDAVKRARLWRLAVAWAAAHPGDVQGRRIRIDAIGLTGRDPATAALVHVEDLR